MAFNAGSATCLVAVEVNKDSLGYSPFNITKTASAASSVTSLIFSHTITTGTNLLLVGVGFTRSGGMTPAITGITYGGSSMTSVVGVDTCSIWKLTTLPSPGAHNIVITPDTGTGGTYVLSAWSYSFQSADTTTPIQDSTGVTRFARANEISASVATIDAGKIIVDILQYSNPTSVGFALPSLPQVSQGTSTIGAQFTGMSIMDGASPTMRWFVPYSHIQTPIENFE